MYKIVAVLALLAAANAVDHQATSFASFNDNHNSIHHINSSPGLAKYASAPAYVAPAFQKVVAAAPVYHHSAAVPQYASIPSGHAYAPAPVHKVALPVVAKYAAAPAYGAHQEEYAPAQYEYAYAIEDSHTGDIHSQQEHRDGDHVVGQYSLHEADGTVRIVKYSDDGHGFNAVVERQGHPTEAPVAYKKVLAVAAPHYHH